MPGRQPSPPDPGRTAFPELDRAPSVGSIVHLAVACSDGPAECCAAIVTATADEGVALTVFYPSGVSHVSASHDETTCEAGTWHWPELL